MDAINEAQVYKFISKHCNNNDLILNIQRALEHYEQIRENRAFADVLEMMAEESTEEMERLRNGLQDMVKKIRSLIP